MRSLFYNDCHAIVKQLSHDRQAAVVQSSSNCRTIVKQLSYNRQAVVARRKQQRLRRHYSEMAVPLQ